MPSLVSSIECLADLPLYKTVKPYSVLQSSTRQNSELGDSNNIVFETHENVTFEDIREQSTEFDIHRQGFQLLTYPYESLSMRTKEDAKIYQHATECFLKERYKADHVTCYDSRVRENVPFSRVNIDLNDPTAREGPARGIHIDATMDSGPTIMQNRLSEDIKEKYLRPGYRHRIINTWRGLIPCIEDRPLAVCDARTVRVNDLVACDRVVPTTVGEIYFVRYNKEQRWYWVDCMRSDELLLMLTYDSRPSGEARYCPHVSIPNPRASPDAIPRLSIETRSIVITQVEESGY